jgi:heme-degrading monooxygenase HmoA
VFARISTYEVPEEKRDDGIRTFGDALREIGDAEGFAGGYYLVSCDGERAMTFTFWESRGAMEASRVTASRLRSEAARESDGGVVSSEEFEIAVDLSSNEAVS